MENKRENIGTDKKSADKKAWDTINELDLLTADVEPVPDLLRLLIDRYDLDIVEQTEQQKEDLKNARKEIYSVLTVAIRTIENFLEKESALVSSK